MWNIGTVIATDRGDQRNSVTNLSQCPFVHHKPTLTCLGLNWGPGDPELRQTDNRMWNKSQKYLKYKTYSAK